MSEFFGDTTSDGRSESSMVDSIIMPILHSSMNRAHQRVHSNDAGVLQRLADQSKFCDLAVMQLDACVSCLQSANADSRGGFHRQSAAYRKLVADLTEIRDRLLGRLTETDLAIADNDRELQRLRIRFRNQRSRNDEEKEQLKEEKNLLEEKRKADLERDNNNKSKSVEDCDQIGSEMNSYKKTIEVAMAVMHNALAISVSEVRPCDQVQHFCWEMEKEIMTALFTGFVRDCQFRSEEESTKSGNNWSCLGELMDDLSSLRRDLDILATSMPKPKVESKDLSITNREERGKDEKMNKVSMIIKAHESIVKKTVSMRESICKRCKGLDELQMCIQRLIQRLDSLAKWNHDKQNRPECKVRSVDTNMSGKEMCLKDNDLDLQVVITGEVQTTLFRFMIMDFQHQIHDHELINSIREVVYRDLFRETIRNDAFLREEIFEQVFKESLTSKLSELVCQNEELRTICNSLIASETQLHIESAVREKVYTLLFKGSNTWSAETDELRIKNSIDNEVFQSTILDTLRDAYSLLKRYESYSIDHCFQDDCSTKEKSTRVDTIGSSSFIQKLDSLLCYSDEDNTLLIPSSNNDKEHNPEFIIHDSEHQVLMIEETNGEMNFNSVCDKFKRALMQLGTSQMILKDLGSDQLADLSDGDSERGLPCNQKRAPTVQVGEESNDQSLCLEETKESMMNHLSGFGYSLGEFSQVITNLESALHQKLDVNFVRLERLKGQLVQFKGSVALLSRKESIYKRAFMRRCEDLQKAETEVDILGDQVNALFSLLQRIYKTIQYHAPALQQCSGVLNILALIKKELNGVMA